jgi:hypothetical protein
MSGFVKIYQTILDSSVWSEPHATRLVWITMLAMADAAGRVEASIGGLARRAQVTKEECENALNVLLSPDPDDKSKIDDGRRIRPCDRGWMITNAEYYRELRTLRQEQTAERVRRHRSKHQNVTRNAVTPGNGTITPVRTEAEAEAEAENPNLPVGVVGSRTRAGARDTQTPKTPKPAKAKSWRKVPTDWQPNDTHREIAKAEGRNFDRELAMFKDHEFAKPRSDADAAFRNWLRDERFKPNGRAPVQTGFDIMSRVERLRAEEKANASK